MNQRTPTTVDINGFAFREIRVRSGVDIGPCAEAIGISRAYLAHIELGRRIRVSPSVFAKMLGALQIGDRRAVLANPHVAGLKDEEVTEEGAAAS